MAEFLSERATDGATERRRYVVVLALCLLSNSLCVLGGCAGLTRRYHQNDLVLARQIARQGADAFHSGDLQRAEHFYAKAVEVCPVDERVRARYAETMWQRGLYKDAIKHQQEAVRLSGDAPEMMIRLGEMYLSQNDVHAADMLALRAIESDAGSAEAYRLRGDVLRTQGRRREALAAYHRALSIQPNLPEVRMAVAQVYQHDGKSQRALSTLQSLAETYPTDEYPAELLYWHGIAYSGLGRHQKAVNHFAQAVARGMLTADVQFRLAESNYLAGDRAAAEAALVRAMQMQPHHPQAARLGEIINGTTKTARVE